MLRWRPAPSDEVAAPSYRKRPFVIRFLWCSARRVPMMALLDRMVSEVLAGSMSSGRSARGPLL